LGFTALADNWGKQKKRLAAASLWNCDVIDNGAFGVIYYYLNNKTKNTMKNKNN
jgi:hypothetical protein